MIDLIEGQFPTSGNVENSSSNNDKEMEEERRLFYVGMTRAKNQLCLIVINNKNNESVVCSRFVGEIYSIINPVDEKNISENKFESMKKGSIVKHKAFGRGEIISIKGNVLVINFDVYGVKNLLLDACIEKKLLYVDSF
jgi:DNA helicase-2/ATP-dependent DNA helicase PcrA